jgi:hypothetical protein
MHGSGLFKDAKCTMWNRLTASTGEPLHCLDGDSMPILVPAQFRRPSVTLGIVRFAFASMERVGRRNFFHASFRSFCPSD